WAVLCNHFVANTYATWSHGLLLGFFLAVLLRVAPMYCTNCGLKQSGNFCAGCGTRLSSPDVAVAALPAGDWRDEVRYAVLLYFPEVRDQLAKVKPGKKKMTGEEWLELCDQAFKPLMHGVPLKALAPI